MIEFNFEKYTDKHLLIKYFALLALMWSTAIAMHFYGMKVHYIALICLLITISALCLLDHRVKSCLKGRFKSFKLEDDKIIFNFWQAKKRIPHKISKIKNVYLTETPRRGKQLNPYHFFLTFEFSQKNVVSSTEIPATRVLEFFDDFNDFCTTHQLNLTINNTDRVQTLLGEQLYTHLLGLHQPSSKQE